MNYDQEREIWARVLKHVLKVCLLIFTGSSLLGSFFTYYSYPTRLTPEIAAYVSQNPFSTSHKYRQPLNKYEGNALHAKRVHLSLV